MAASSAFDPLAPVCVLTKGIEPGTGLLMTQIVEEELGSATPVVGLSGPNHAEEICKGLPAAAVVASDDPDACDFFKALLLRETFRIYVSSDVVGVEACGALKNVMAIACGVAAGMGMGDNTLAVLMTRGLAEMTRIATAMGADALTCMGLAGMGDLVVTCTSEHSRNRTFGEALAKGVTLAEYEAKRHMVVEGARACYSASELAEKLGVDAPLTEAVRMILDGTSLGESVQTLLSRIPHTEFYGLYGSEE
jgi:glycerol-3-phosphate dehydrogenase (NAD(P)+)